MVDAGEVRKVAENARLKLEDSEAEEMRKDLSKILDFFSSIDEVDTENVEPAFHPVEVEPEAREDETEECLSREEVFQNTCNDEDGRFKGPSV